MNASSKPNKILGADDLIPILSPLSNADGLARAKSRSADKGGQIRIGDEPRVRLRIHPSCGGGMHFHRGGRKDAQKCSEARGGELQEVPSVSASEPTHGRVAP